MDRYVVGIDGGGTKTEVVIAGLEGGTIGRFVSGAVNINGESVKNVEGNLKDILKKISESIMPETPQENGVLKNCRCICMGAAGVSNPAAKETLKKAFSAGGYDGELIIAGDHETALYGALEEPDGIILIAGTGSICYGRNRQGLEKRTGGFGYLIDDEGSGYAIGRDILTAVVREKDGRGEPTLLAEMVFSQLNIKSIDQLIGFIYAAETNKRDIAKLAPNLTAACDLGDRTALSIAQKCGNELLLLVTPVVRELDLFEGDIALAGSVLQKDKYIQGFFADALKKAHPGLKWSYPRHGAAYGAVLMAIASAKKS